VSISGKAGLARGIQGTVGLVVELAAKLVVVPSRDRSPGSNRG